MPRIAISYRRADSAVIAGRIFDRLTAHFGENSVFMDIEQIPFGVDFRDHIRAILASTDVLIALIGPNWLGVATEGTTRMHEKSDPVRMEIEAALAQGVKIIPVLIDGAEMPESGVLPPAFNNFAFLNAAEVASGRDFRLHMERLISAIDQILAAGHPEAARLARPGSQMPVTVVRKSPVHAFWQANLLLFLSGAVLLLLVSHYLILINNLDNVYLWLTCAAIPFIFGLALLWVGGYGVGHTLAMAFALGVICDAGMTLSASLISGDPVLPQNRSEWRDNIQFATTVALSFMLGYALACALEVVRKRRAGEA